LRSGHGLYAIHPTVQLTGNHRQGILLIIK
jgi:hypothetical protein